MGNSRYEGCWWATTERGSGQIVSELFPVGPGLEEPVDDGELTAMFDASDRTWRISLGSQSVEGKGDLPSPVEAERLFAAQ